MAAREAGIDFQSPENHFLLNPRWPLPEAEELKSLVQRVNVARGLKGHLWFATSGSTANSVSGIKLVALSKEALLASARAVNRHLQVSPQDRWAQVLPTFHVGGMGIEARAFLSGSSVHEVLKNGRWDVDHFYQQISEQRCTLSALVPTQVYDLVLKSFAAPPDLRAIVVGGGALGTDLYHEARKLGWPLLPSYGMTETCSQIATASLRSLQSLKFPDIELLSHAQARQSAEGFLEVQAESLLTCYAQQQHEPESWDPKNNQWLLTEDRGEVQGRFLQITGRSKDYIKIGGEATNMARLREILDGIAHAMDPLMPFQVTLLDWESERLGSEIHLVSTLDATTSALLAERYAKKVLPFERIRQIRYLKDIPRSALGKILWGEVRRKL